MSDATVGSIIGLLKLDTSDWNEKLDAAGAKADELGAHSPNIKVNVDSAKALAQLAALAAAEKRLNDSDLNVKEAETKLATARDKLTAASQKAANTEETYNRLLANKDPAAITMAGLLKKARADQAYFAQQAQAAENNLAKAMSASDLAGLKLVATTAKITKANDDAAKKADDTASAFDKMAGASGGATFKPLLDSLMLFGPALGPIITVAAGAAGAFVFMGASGVLAVKGIKNEMAQGTPLGQQYAQTLSVLKDNLAQLEHSAASGFLGPFNAAVMQAQKSIPGLNTEVKGFASITGDVAGHVLNGLVGGFRTLQPLFQQIAVMADHGAASFDRWANSSDGLGKFGASAASWLPKVTSTLGDVAQAIGHIVSSLGPLGGTSLTILSTLANVINSLPVPVITALATAFIAVRTASMGLSAITSIVSGVGTALQKLGAQSAGATGLLSKVGAGGTGVAAGLGLMGGAAAIGAFALVGLTVALQSNAKAHQENVQYVNSFADALRQSKGAVDENVASTAANILVQNGWIAAGKKVGLSAGTMTQAVLGNKGAMDQVNEAFRKAGQGMSPIPVLVQNLADKFSYAQKQQQDWTDATTENNKALAASNPALARQAAALGLTVTNLQQAQTAVTDKKNADIAAAAVQKLLVAQNYQLMGSQASLGQLFGITTSQVQQYAAMLGITQDAVTAGTVGMNDYNNAVMSVANAENNATQTGTAFLSALQAFSASAGTAADRAALIGVTLKAANGDNLSFANAMNGSAVALKDLVDGVKRLPAETGKAHLTIKDFVGSIVNLKTGTIDYTKSAAQPLIQGLQKVQDAAMAAAQAQYQHEVATRGGKLAADDAYKTYVGQTRGALMDEASQLGLTKDQAKRLADQYFGMPKDVKTKIEQEGADPIKNVLNSIKSILLAIAKGWGITVTADTSQATARIQNLQGLLANLNANIETGASKQARQQVAAAGHHAGGGLIAGPGTGTSDDIPAWLSNGEYVMKADAVKKYGRAFFDKANSLRLASGGLVGSTAQKAAAQHAAVVAQQQANIRFTVSTDLPRVFAGITGSVASLAATLRKLLNDVHTAATKGVGGSSVVDLVNSDNAKLLSLANSRANIANKIKAADAVLAQRQSQFNTERSNVSQAYTGMFDITNAGGDAADIIATLQTQLSAAKDTSALVNNLKSKHLNNALLEKIASSPNSPNALALQGASSAQIAQINKLYGSLNSTGNAAGNTVAMAMYGAGVNAAKGLVRGLKSQEKALESQMSRLARVLVDTIRKDLKIHSPSQVGHELGAFFGQGMANGIQSQHVTVRRAASGLADSAVPAMPAATSAAAGPMSIRVFIGDRELTDLVRVEVDNHSDDLANQLVYGRAS